MVYNETPRYAWTVSEANHTVPSNSFFTNIGANITANVSMSNSDLFKGYLCQPTDRDFRFAPVSEEDVIKIIHNLKPKSSCGFDEI